MSQFAITLVNGEEIVLKINDVLNVLTGKTGGVGIGKLKLDPHYIDSTLRIANELAVNQYFYINDNYDSVYSSSAVVKIEEQEVPDFEKEVDFLNSLNP